MGIAFAFLVSIAFGAGDEYLGSLSAHPWGSVRSLSAPWLVLPFVVGATQREPRRAALLGLACTLAALLGYGLTIGVAEHRHLMLPAIGGYLQNERLTFAASLVTGPLFGWFGWRWRTRRAIAGALVTAAALSLEPLVRKVTVKPIRFADVRIAEVAVGLAFAGAVLIRRHRERSLE